MVLPPCKAFLVQPNMAENTIWRDSKPVSYSSSCPVVAIDTILRIASPRQHHQMLSAGVELWDKFQREFWRGLVTMAGQAMVRERWGEKTFRGHRAAVP